MPIMKKTDDESSVFCVCVCNEKKQNDTFEIDVIIGNKGEDNITTRQIYIANKKIYDKI